MAIAKINKEVTSAPKKETSEKQKALELALSAIEKQFGKGSIMKMGQNAVVDIPAIPTGALTLDMALGVGGIPRGRVTEYMALNQAVKPP